MNEMNIEYKVAKISSVLVVLVTMLALTVAIKWEDVAGVIASILIITFGVFGYYAAHRLQQENKNSRK